MFDFVPPAVLLIMHLCVSVRVLATYRELPHARTVLICALAPLIYAVGALFFLALDSEAMLALAAVGTLAVPVGILLLLYPSRQATLALTALAVTAWGFCWLSRSWLPLRGWNSAELAVGFYLAVAVGLAIVGLVRGRGQAGLIRRVLVVAALPTFTVALVYVLTKSRLTRVPVVSTSILVGAELALLLLLRDRPSARRRTTPVTLLVELVLLITGALLLYTFAAKLGAFPQQDPLALAVTVVLSAAIALSYGLLRPHLEGVLADAFYPEVQQARARVRELQGELAAAQERLRQAEHLSLIGQLAAQVAHEIKNPLGPIKGYAKVIERELERAGVESEPASRGLDVIRQEVESIDARARALLELGRPPQPELQAVDYAAVIQDALDLAEGERPGEISLGWRTPPPAAAGTSDPVLLRSALSNVIKNALQALLQRGGPGAIELELRPREDGWELWVDDDGPGLPAGLEPEALFKPFLSKREGGTGLGLVIARGALRALGGELRLAARDEGGVRASFWLAGVGGAPPRSADPIEAPEEAPAEDEPAQERPARTSSSAS